MDSCKAMRKYSFTHLYIQKTKITAAGPITSWEIDGETVETVSDFIFLGSKIQSLHALKLYKVYLHIFAIPIQQIIPVNYLSEKRLIKKKKKKAGQKRTWSWFSWEQGSLFPWVLKTISFPLRLL